ncbi:MAG TPA: hypothetical protein VHP36_08570 [Chitinispirillaceae bacterium]|nr:hypothetical protein [Chitinispirillaceae bacterium]
MNFSSFSLMAILFFTGANSLIFGQLTGQITYTINRESNPTQDQLDAYAKIKEAMDSATGFYNQYTTLTKNLNVSYNTSVQTADASSNGNMRFGSNRSYMVVHTAMHEISHTLGIGTTNEYKNLIQNGIFNGPLATAILREITRDPDTLLHGDQQHFWPFGLNYASEIKSKQDLINHCKIVNEMYKDMFKEVVYRVCRLRSKSDGRFMVVRGNSLALGSGNDSLSLVRMIALDGDNVFKLEFGSKVLDMPNESKNAGVAAGLYSWNHGAHQKTIFEFESLNKDVARIKMSHSGLYLRTDGNKIVQDQPSVSKETQYWELVADQNPVFTREQSKISSANEFEIINNRIIFSPSMAGLKSIDMQITDLYGRVIRSEFVNTNQEYYLPKKGISSGLYMIMFQIKEQKISRRFIAR